jgi:hypothetical protein
MVRLIERNKITFTVLELSANVSISNGKIAFSAVNQKNLKMVLLSHFERDQYEM